MQRKDVNHWQDLCRACQIELEKLVGLESISIEGLEVDAWLQKYAPQAIIFFLTHAGACSSIIDVEVAVYAAASTSLDTPVKQCNICMGRTPVIAPVFRLYQHVDGTYAALLPFSATKTMPTVQEPALRTTMMAHASSFSPTERRRSRSPPPVKSQSNSSSKEGLPATVPAPEQQRPEEAPPLPAPTEAPKPEEEQAEAPPAPRSDLMHRGAVLDTWSQMPPGELTQIRVTLQRFCNSKNVELQIKEADAEAVYAAWCNTDDTAVLLHTIFQAGLKYADGGMHHARRLVQEWRAFYTACNQGGPQRLGSDAQQPYNGEVPKKSGCATKAIQKPKRQRTEHSAASSRKQPAAQRKVETPVAFHSSPPAICNLRSLLTHHCDVCEGRLHPILYWLQLQAKRLQQPWQVLNQPGAL